MAMFECPGCKHIVDDSIKKCPNCSYDIKKYVKTVLKDKKNGKGGDVSIALGSVYGATKKENSLPKLDFLSNIPAPEPVAAPAYEEPAAPAYEEPAAPVYEEPAAPAYEAPVAPAYEAPVAPVSAEPVAQPTSAFTAAAPSASPLFSAIPAPKPAVAFPEPETPAPAPVAPVASAAPVAPAAPLFDSPVLNQQNAMLSQPTMKVAPPASAAPERKPVTSNSRSLFPKPIYHEENVGGITPPKPVSPAPAVPETPIFDSPELNAQHAAGGISGGARATSASLAGLSSGPSFGNSFAQPMGQNYISSQNSTLPVSESAEKGEGLLFESPALNAQHKMIQSGEYVPTSTASQATMSLLDKPISTSGTISSGTSQTTFGLGTFGQSSSYKMPVQAPASQDPVLGGGNALLGAQPPQTPNNAFNPNLNPFAQANAMHTAAAANPLLGGSANPLLGGGNVNH